MYRIISVFMACLLFSTVAFSQGLPDSTLEKFEKFQAKLDSVQQQLKADSADLVNRKNLMFSVGGNLDFLKSPNINGAYFDVSGFIPRFSSPKDKNFFSRFGLEARLSQGRFAANSDSINIENSQTILTDFGDDSISVLSQDYQFKRETVQSYLGFMATPTIRLNKQASFPLFLGLHLEFIQRTTTNKTGFIVTRQDTLSTIREPSKFYRSSSVVDQERATTNQVFNQIFAPAFLFDFDKGKVNYRIKGLFGGVRETPDFGIDEASWNWFYLAQFSVHYMGTGSFKIGGEVRSFLGESPLASVYLAKTFSFETLAKLFD